MATDWTHKTVRQSNVITVNLGQELKELLNMYLAQINATPGLKVCISDVVKAALAQFLNQELKK